MTELDVACKDLVDRTEGALACAVVDVATTTVMGLYRTVDQQEAATEQSSLGAAALVAGAEVLTAAQLVRQSRELDTMGKPKTIDIHIVANERAYFLKSIRNGDQVVALVARSSVNTGLAWAMLKATLSNIDSAVGKAGR